MPVPPDVLDYIRRTQVPTTEFKWIWEYVADRARKYFRSMPYRPAGLTEEELAHEAQKAATLSAPLFRPETGYRASTYLVNAAAGKVSHYLRDAYRGHLNRREYERCRCLFMQDLPQHAKPPLSLDTLLLSIHSGAKEEVTLGELQRAPTINSDLKILLEQALASLPPRERQALTIYRLEGYSQREVGTALGITQMQVSRSVRNAEKLIRDRYPELAEVL